MTSALTEPTPDDKRRIYERYTDVYEQRTADYGRFLAPDYERFAAALPGPRVLDLGCGPGRDAAHFASLGLQPLCLDMSQTMLERCRQRGLQTMQMDIERLELPAQSFDGIWSYTSLTTIPQRKVWPAIAKLRQALVPDGVLFLGLIEGDREGWKPADDKYDTPRYISRYQANQVIERMAGSWQLIDYRRLGSEQTQRNSYLHFLYRPRPHRQRTFALAATKAS